MNEDFEGLKKDIEDLCELHTYIMNTYHEMLTEDLNENQRDPGQE